MTESDFDADLHVAECPLSWCDHTERVDDPDGKFEVAMLIQEHVNSDHSEKDIQTLRNA